MRALTACLGNLDLGVAPAEVARGVVVGEQRFQHGGLALAILQPAAVEFTGAFDDGAHTEALGDLPFLFPVVALRV